MLTSSELKEIEDFISSTKDKKVLEDLRSDLNLLHNVEVDKEVRNKLAVLIAQIGVVKGTLK